MNLIVDMNLSPVWVPVLRKAGQSAVHWSSVGSPRATDSEILAWARQHEYVVFTHDLDFGAILAATHADSPSVIQIRTQDPTPKHCAQIIFGVLDRYADTLRSGALISVDERRSRIQILPLREED